MENSLKKNIESLKLYLDSREWYHNVTYYGEDQVFTFDLELDCKIGKIHYIIQIDDNFCQFMTTIPCKFNDDKKCQVSEYIHRVNLDSPVSRFDMDYDANTVGCHYATTIVDVVPTDAFWEMSILLMEKFLEDYSDGLLDVMCGNGTAKEVFEIIFGELNKETEF